MQPPVTPIRVTGGSYPARIWQAFMEAALADVPVQEFPAVPTTTTTVPPSTTTTLATATTGAAQTVPDVVGQLRDAAISTLQSSGFRVAVAERTTGGASPGVVLAQAPGAGSQLGAGSVVTIEVAVPPGNGNGNGNSGSTN
jgi:penicillin-binding protein 1A